MEEQALIKFDYGEKPVRTWVDPECNPWFCGKDVCLALLISNHNDALGRIRKDWKHGVGLTDPIGRIQTTIFINEPALYKLVFRSRKPEAERFTNWVAGEVLPSIRRTGTFTARPISSLEALRVAVDHMIRIEEEQLRIASSVDRHEERLRQLETKRDKLYDPDVQKKPITPTQLGAYFEPPLSARKINRILYEHGFQWKVGGQWIATEKGKPYSLTVAREPRPDLIVHQLLWQRRTIDLLR